ncbi:hypothetical protein HDU85_006156 [Gaertneriomyces sp. JEL0708]|nr:hypothetical protein HDU85_006156 [Gaertneriomyces sp. JEL0708]
MPSRRRDSVGDDSDGYFDPDDPDFVVGDDEVAEDDDEDLDADYLSGDDDDVVVRRNQGRNTRRRAAVKQVCRYGTACYRRNPVHFAEFAHPWLDKDHEKQEATGVSSSSASAIDNNRSTNESRSLARHPSSGKRKSSNDEDEENFDTTDDEASTPRKTVLKKARPEPDNGSPLSPPSPHRPHQSSNEALSSPVIKPRSPVDAPSVTPPSASPSPQQTTATDERQDPENTPRSSKFVRIAIPSIGTAEGHIPIEQAAVCASTVIRQFCNTHSERYNFELLLVDPDTSVLDEFKQHLNGVTQFRTLQADDISILNTQHDLPSQVLITEMSWRWKTSATAGCHQIHHRAGTCLMERARELYPKAATIGTAYTIPVPTSSPLHQDERVEFVVHFVAPNMNANRPNCLSGIHMAIKQLESTYRAALKCVDNILIGVPVHSPAPAAPVRDAFSTLMSSKPSASSAISTAEPAMRGDKRDWSDALMPYCREPERYPDVVTYDQQVVIMKDKYAKAKMHFLVLPRRRIDGLLQLSKDDVSLLDDMKGKADELVEGCKALDPDVTFRIGFHAIPSMRQLHMHVISQDFQSPSLKNKKHWNSFNTEFFRDFEDVRSRLTNTGKVVYDEAEYEALLKEPLRCHRCRAVCSNMPKLKEHIAVCRD